LLISNPRIHGKVVDGPVHTTQIAPTILELLGLDFNKLEPSTQDDGHGCRRSVAKTTPRTSLPAA